MISTGYENMRALAPGEELYLFDEGRAATAVWTSSDEGIARIGRTEYGNATLVGVSPGEVVVTVRFGDKTEQATFHVVDLQLPVALAVELPQKDHPSGAMQMRAFLDYGHRYRKDVTSDAAWSSSDASVARSDGGGRYVGLKEGDVSVTAVCAGHVGRVDAYQTDGALFVIGPPLLFDRELIRGVRYSVSTRVTTSAKDTREPRGLEIEVVPADAAVLTEHEGRRCITGLRTGPLRVIARLGRMVAEQAVEVIDAELTMAELRTNATTRIAGEVLLFVGERVDVYVELRRAGGSLLSEELNVVWSTSNPAVLTKEGYGVVGVAPGSAFVRATYGGLERTLAFRVSEEPEIQWF